MEFSFAKESGLVLVNHLSSMIPLGADIHVYFAAKGKLLYRADYKNYNLSIAEIKDDDELNHCYDIRKSKKTSYSWEINPLILAQELNKGKKNFQFTINHEQEHLILCMRFKSSYDENNDVVYISFRHDLSLFGIETGLISMNPENKTIIAKLLYSSCASILQTAQADYQAFNTFTDKTRSAIDSVKVYKEKLKQLSDEHHKNTVSLAQNFIKGLSDKFNTSFVFTDECIESLKNFSSNLPRLQRIVENAAEYAFNLNSIKNTKIITIEEEYLEFLDSDLSIEKQELTPKSKKVDEDSLIRIEKYLHRLENAVKKVMANKEKPIGENVAKALKPQVSSASITIYLKSNAPEINEILTADTTKFSLSKQYFKPLVNVIYQSKLDSKVS